MKKPVVIVDPYSSGSELAPTFKKIGIPCIAVTFKDLNFKGYGTKVRNSDFIKVIRYSESIVEDLKNYNPLAVISGAEFGIPYAEKLANELTPEFANDPNLSLTRRHKALMQQVLAEKGVTTLKTFKTSDIVDAEKWIIENGLENQPFVLKPPVSTGSDKVFHIDASGDWKTPFRRILDEPSIATHQKSEEVVIQEMAVGTEYAFGTVSAKGKHHLAHIIKYNKMAFAGRKTVYDFVEFIPFNEDLHREMFDYVQLALDAVGIKWGAAHSEIILTEDGPRLIETSARMCGGPTVRFARAACQSSQADKWVEAIAYGDVQNKSYNHQKTVMPVFLKSPAKGIVKNIEVFEDVSKLPTLLDNFLYYQNGDQIPQTQDYIVESQVMVTTSIPAEVTTSLFLSNSLFFL